MMAMMAKSQQASNLLCGVWKMFSFPGMSSMVFARIQASFAFVTDYCELDCSPRPDGLLAFFTRDRFDSGLNEEEERVLVASRHLTL